MSLLGASIGKFAIASGGLPTAGAIVGSGLLVGAIAGASFGGGFAGPSPQPSIAKTDIYPCPNVGPALISINSGQHVLVVGKSADGEWLEIMYPSGALDSAWVPAAAYGFIGGASAEDVPVTECDSATVTALVVSPTESPNDIGSFEPTPLPTASPTQASATPTPPSATPPQTSRGTPPPIAKPTAKPKGTPAPTPKPTPPPTPAPTPPPDTTPPRIANPSASPSEIISGKCGGPEKATVTVSVSDAGGVKSVVLAWSGGTTSGSKAMSLSGGTWTTTLSISGDTLFPNSYTLKATATDNAGNKSTSGGGSLTVNPCIT